MACYSYGSLMDRTTWNIHNIKNMFYLFYFEVNTHTFRLFRTFRLQTTVPRTDNIYLWLKNETWIEFFKKNISKYLVNRINFTLSTYFGWGGEGSNIFIAIFYVLITMKLIIIFFKFRWWFIYASFDQIQNDSQVSLWRW